MSPVTHGLATWGTLLASAIPAVTLAGMLSTFAVLTGWSVLRAVDAVFQHFHLLKQRNNE